MKKTIIFLFALLFVTLAGRCEFFNSSTLDTYNFTIPAVTLLDGVTATGASDAQDVSSYDKKTFHVVASSVSTGGTVKIQTSLDNTNWVDLHEESITANGTTEIAVNGYKHKYIRANLTARTDGTYTVIMIAGN